MNSTDTVDYDQQRDPFVIRNILNVWPCFQWSLQDWADKCHSTKFRFRVHKKTNKDSIDWENEAIDYIDATMSQLVDFFEQNEQQSNQLSDIKINPFSAYPISEFCFYSGYNYMDQVLNKVQNSEIIDSIKWAELKLGESKLLNDASNSTIWIGSTGSYTPCHMDTYGYNFVAQVYGKKRWILFPPSNTPYLYPTRIPYEESSIFSQVNINSIDIKRFPNFSQTQPRIVELEHGDVLFVPRHWWHFVENIGCYGTDINISVNSWIAGQELQNSISECLVHLLARPLFEAYGSPSWFNLNADLFSTEESLRTILLLMKNYKIEPSNNKKQTLAHQIEYLHELELNDILKIKHALTTETNLDADTDKQSNHPELCAKDIVNCILDPDVIELICNKLISCCKNK